MGGRTPANAAGTPLLPRLAGGVPGIPSRLLLNQQILLALGLRGDLLGGTLFGRTLLGGGGGLGRLTDSLALGGALLARKTYGEAVGLLRGKGRVIHDGVFAEFLQLGILRSHRRALPITKTFFLKTAH